MENKITENYEVLHQEKANKYASDADKFIHRFSTEEAAKEYVIMNNPCLSIKDVGTVICLYRETEHLFKELVKSKLDV